MSILRQTRRTRDGCRRTQRRRRSPAFVKSWNLFAAMVMLSSLIGSIALTPASSAAASAPTCDNGQVWDDTQQMCVDPTPEGGDQNQDMPTETPADMSTQTPTPEMASVNVYKYTCPQMYDFNQSGANPASDCTIPTDGVTMTLADVSQQQQQQTSGGVATFGNVMPGQFSLTETAPSNTAQAAWTCESPMQAPTSGSGSQIQGQIAAGEQVSCRFYNIPNGITIQVKKYLCPEGYDVSDQNANPQADCNQSQDGVQFNVNGQTTGYTSQSNTGDSETGAVNFGGLQPDTYTITETLPQGTSSAFVTQCVQTTLAGQQIPHYPTVTNGAIQYQFDNNDLSLVCDWYNVPGTTGTPGMTPTPTMEMGSATPTMPSNGLTIVIHKFTCPAGYDASGQNANPQLDCATMQDGVQFNLTGTNTGYTSQTNTGDSIPGSVMFGGLQPDTYTIVETPPMGTGSAFVTYCTLSTTNDPDVPIYPGLGNWSIQQDFDATAIKFECYWYNVPSISGSGDGTPTTVTPTMTPTMSGTPATPVSTEPSTLYIYKWLCPEGYNPAAMGANPATDCATPQNGVQFNITGKTNGYTSQTNTGDSIPGAVMFGGIQPDTYHVVETFPPKTDFAFVTQCTVEPAGGVILLAPSMPINPVVTTTGETDIVVPGGVTITCQWYNVPKSGSSDLTVHKQNCDVETYVDDSSCTPNTTGVSFEVYRKDGANWVLKASAATDGTGTIALSGLNPGTYKLTELGGMWCHIVATHKNADGADVNALNPDGSFELVDGFETVVVVSNCTGGTGDITIYKWTCPPGYDYTKYGADPKTECTQATNGVQFNLAGQNKGYTSQTNTGDSINGAVYFGGIPTDTYTVTETVPADTWYVFVWDCTGSSVNQVNPMPLSTGNVLNIKVAAKDKITCNWYNVPNRTSGDLTIYKEWCTQPVFTSDVDCTVYEKGMTFTVNVKNGATWTPVGTQTTNNLGYIALSGLNPGTYQVVEQGGTPCKVVATQLDPNTNKYVSVLNPDQSFPVTNGRETVVKVYNCTPKGKPAPPTKVPSKYPNTGVDPNAGTSPLSAQDTQVIEPGTPQTVEAPDATETPTTTTGTPESNVEVCPTLTAADNAAKSPIGTPIPDTTCARGQVPASISIPSIQVEATFEIKEIVGGELQEPTNENVVTWYKNTNRLGETGNVVVAGHLNYWGVPEAVFFKLNTLKQGDLITVTGADGGVYTYAVTSVQSVPITESPETWVGPTDKESITLMTCGGEWDSSISEYDSRTVVTAVRVPNPEAQQGGA